MMATTAGLSGKTTTIKSTWKTMVKPLTKKNIPETKNESWKMNQNESRKKYCTYIKLW